MALERLNVALTTITKERLAKLSKSDLRSMNQEINWLIEQEHRRRTEPARTLTDQGVSYSIGKPSEDA